METDVPYLSKVFTEEYESAHNCESHCIFKCSFHIELQHMDQIVTVHEGEKLLGNQGWVCRC